MIERLKAMVCKSTLEDEKFVLVGHKALTDMFHKINELVVQVNELKILNANKIDSGTVNCRCSVKPIEDVKFGKWISVKDRLPEQDVMVLTYYSISGAVDFHALHRGDFCLLKNDKLIPDYGITHWMPLPEPPEVGVE